MPSCLVLDVRLSGASGLEFQRDLASAKDRIPIIFITGHGDIPMSVRAMKAGALGTTESPVKSHRAQKVRKMQASTLADLIRMANRLQLAQEEAA